MIEALSAVTLATHDMARAVALYAALGFELKSGGPEAGFTSFHAGSGYLNLTDGREHADLMVRVGQGDLPCRRCGRTACAGDRCGRPVARICAPPDAGMGRALFPHHRSGRTRTQLRAPAANSNVGVIDEPSSCHCEERSDEAIPIPVFARAGRRLLHRGASRLSKKTRTPASPRVIPALRIRD